MEISNKNVIFPVADNDDVTANNNIKTESGSVTFEKEGESNESKTN
jgi:hypothetical protein